MKPYREIEEGAVLKVGLLKTVPTSEHFSYYWYLIIPFWKNRFGRLSFLLIRIYKHDVVGFKIEFSFRRAFL